MKYGQILIDRAANVCGSRYALAKRLSLNESNLAQVYAGKRRFPVEWAAPMALVAGLEPGEAILRIVAERDGGKPWGPAIAAIGAAGTLLISYASSAANPDKLLTVASACMDCLRIVSKRRGTRTPALATNAPTNPARLHASRQSAEGLAAALWHATRGRRA